MFFIHVVINTCMEDKDSNNTPLGELADYIATHWKKVKKLGSYEILDEFYLQYS